MNPVEPIAFARDDEFDRNARLSYADFEWQDVAHIYHTEKIEIATVMTDFRRIDLNEECYSCANNGACHWITYGNDFFCSCPLGFEGKRCEIVSRLVTMHG